MARADVQGDTVSILTILEFPDPRLRTVAAPVTVFDADPDGLPTSSGNAALIALPEIAPIASPGFFPAARPTSASDATDSALCPSPRVSNTRTNSGPGTLTHSTPRPSKSSGAGSVTAQVSSADSRAIAITLTPTAGGKKTRVNLLPSGYPSKNECYAQCIKGWEHFLSSLALYTTTGKGAPFDVKVNGPAPARRTDTVARGVRL